MNPAAPAAPAAPNAFRVVDQELVNERTDRIQEHPANPREGDIGAVFQSIKSNGFYGACIVQRSTGFILAGNHRYKAAVEAGATTIPVLYIDVDDDRARRILLVDNRSNDLATYNEQSLADELTALFEATGTLDGTGYDGDDLDQILADLGRDLAAATSDGNSGEAADAELQALTLKWGTKEGQVWRIPSVRVPGAFHRLIIGDSTRAETFDRLMQGEKAQLCYTDPPYGVDYESDAHGKIANDALAGAALRTFLAAAFTHAVRHTLPNAAFYIWHASSTRRQFEDAMADAGLAERQYIIWAKEAFVMGRSNYHWQHEPCFYAHKHGQPLKFTEDRTQSTLWTIGFEPSPERPTFLNLEQGILLAAEDGSTMYLAPQAPKNKKLQLHRVKPTETLAITTDGGSTDLWRVQRDPAEAYLHPTQKPVALAMRAIRNSTDAGDRVLDMFHGGGATLVGCEQLGRLANVAELDPRFAAFNLERAAELGLHPEMES